MSRDAILAAVKRNRPPDVPLPELAGLGQLYADPIARFSQVLSSVHGDLIEAATMPEAEARLRKRYAAARHVLSLIEGIDWTTHPVTDPARPRELEPLDLVIAPGEFAVAETGAVWVAETERIPRAAWFITRDLALVVPHMAMSHTMHEAYARVKIDAAPYGCFIAGPSKTADIEQNLVIGAHGPRTVTVVLVGG